MTKNFFSSLWSKIKNFKQKQPLESKKSDLRLIKDLRGRKIPSWDQVKNVKKVMSGLEKRIFNLSIFVFFIGLILLGLSYSNNYSTEVAAVGGRYIEGEVGEPHLINPLFADLNDVDKDISSLVYSGLIRVNKNQDIVPDLAKNYDISDDKKTYTFHLREDVLWHDGEKFTAEDVAFTINQIQKKQVSSPLYVTFRGVNVKVKDEYTVQFRLKQPSPFFLQSLTIGILPEHIWFGMSPERMRLSQSNIQPIGTGPYKFNKLSKDDSGYIHRYELVRNDKFYRKPPYIETFEFKFFNQYGGTSGLIQALREQSVDGVNFVPRDMKEKIEKKHINTHELGISQYTSLFLNQKRTPLDQKKIRTALSKTVDKKRIIEEGLNGDATIINDPILSVFPGGEFKVTSTEFNIKAANKILNEDWPKIEESEYRDLRIDDLISQFGLEGTASTSTLQQYEKQNTEAEFTGDSPESYDYSVVINDNADSTNNKNIQLSLNGEDIKSYAVSNNGDFDKKSFKDYSGNVNWELSPGNGKQSVYVRLLTEDGKTQDIYDTIELTGQLFDKNEIIEQEINPNSDQAQQVKNMIEQELDEAQTFYRKNEDGEILSIGITTTNNQQYKKIAKLVAGFWREIGVKVDLNIVSSKKLSSELLRNRNYDVLLYGIINGSDPNQYPYWHSSQSDYPGLNLSQYSNEEVDKLLEDARKLTDKSKIAEKYKQVQQIIAKNNPAIFLYTPTYTYAQNSSVNGFDVTGMYSPHDRFANVTDWYLETKKEWTFSK